MAEVPTTCTVANPATLTARAQLLIAHVPLAQDAQKPPG